MEQEKPTPLKSHGVVCAKPGWKGLAPQLTFTREKPTALLLSVLSELVREKTIFLVFFQSVFLISNRLRQDWF